MEEVPSAPPIRTRLWQLAAFFFLLAALAVAVDIPVSQTLRTRLPGDLRRVVTWSELFAHGLGVGLIALLVVVLDPLRRAELPRVVGTAWGAGIVADVLKLLVARFRPNHLSPERITESFAGWLPVVYPVAGYRRLDHAVQSFPSAHTAVATGLALSLAVVYPRGRWMFALFAGLAACQRIESGAHYLSDTLAGAAVGCVVAAGLRARLPPSSKVGAAISDAAPQAAG